MNDKPTGAGRSSFGLVDVGKLFSELDLGPGDVFLDLGSGFGAYALAASDYVGDDGVVYAVDLWEEGIESLRSQAETRQIGHIRAQVADLSKHIPVDDDAVDVALLSTVLHDLVRDGTQQGALQEIARVLKLHARLAVVEFKKIAGPPGPPLAVRLSPQDVEALLRPHAFDVISTLELGPYNYLSIFLRSTPPEDR
jgi:ubiquinone/menaquinone biosynthesis C-methylase UbiE